MLANFVNNPDYQFWGHPQKIVAIEIKEVAKEGEETNWRLDLYFDLGMTSKQIYLLFKSKEEASNYIFQLLK